jgi:hypothetical protein
MKNSISRRIGCRMEWDSWSSRDIPTCSTVEQLLQFEKEYRNIYFVKTNTIPNETGCFAPCIYNQYKLLAEPINNEDNNIYLGIESSSNTVLKRTEELLYPIESFVSEFGGALGLFLGFSFIMVWDVIILLFQYCLKSKFKCIY